MKDGEEASYAYNKVYQRISEAVSLTGPLKHPAAGGTTAYSPDAIDRYTTVGAASLSYDGNGDVTGDGFYTYSYDAESRLTGVTGGGHTTSYTYDPAGRRASRTVDGAAIWYIYDGQQAIAVYGASQTLLAHHVYGAGLDEPVIMFDAAGARYHPQLDGHGSVFAVTDASGLPTVIFAYGPYGETAQVGGYPFRYAGRRFDPESGLYDDRARMYAPALGRFLQPDPIGTAGGINLYAYVGNDPLNFVDPQGLAAEWAVNNPGTATHWVLTGASFCPSFCGSVSSVADSLVYALQGDWQGAGISVVAALGGIVSDAGVAKVAALGVKELAAEAKVAKYEVGTYDALKARSAVNDTLDIHHVVQANPADQVIEGYSRSGGASIALPKVEHQLIPNISGSYNGTARDLLARDIRNLRNYTGAPNSSLQQLIELNKSLYPGAFAK